MRSHTCIVAACMLILFPFFVAGSHAGQLEPMTAIPIPDNNQQTVQKIELGKILFFDRRLSGDGTMSCATCHDPEKGFSDDLPMSQSYPTTKNWRNAPTLYNVGLQKYLFLDGRTRSLEEQALFPVMSAFEMNRNLDYVEEVIRSVPEYTRVFGQVFGGAVTRERIAMAIAAFERSIVSKETPLDRFLKGDRSALSAGAAKGYDVFMNKGKCSTCHDGVLLADDTFHNLGVPKHEEEHDPRVAATRRFVAKVSGYEDYVNLTEDPGRYLVTKNRIDWKAFRTPTLREIAKTGPYMHNGVFETLDQVIDFFDQGGGTGNTAIKPLHLTSDEKRSLKTFLEESLSSEAAPFIYPIVP